MTKLILDSINRVSAASRLYKSHTSPIRTSSPEGILIVSALRALQNELQTFILAENKKLVVSISRGQSNLPRILYVAISRATERLSAEPSVCICFEEGGRGFVVGMMYPMLYLRKARFDKVRREGGPMQVDLSSKKSTLNFNNLFVNPLELIVGQIDVATVLNHLRISIGMLEQEIVNYVNRH